MGAIIWTKDLFLISKTVLNFLQLLKIRNSFKGENDMSKKQNNKGNKNCSVCISCSSVNGYWHTVFPLTGEKHTEIWSADQQFDIAKFRQLKRIEKTLKSLCLRIPSFGQALVKTRSAMSRWMRL